MFVVVLPGYVSAPLVAAWSALLAIPILVLVRLLTFKGSWMSGRQLEGGLLTVLAPPHVYYSGAKYTWQHVIAMGLRLMVILSPAYLTFLTTIAPIDTSVKVLASDIVNTAYPMPDGSVSPSTLIAKMYAPMAAGYGLRVRKGRASELQQEAPLGGEWKYTRQEVNSTAECVEPEYWYTGSKMVSFCLPPHASGTVQLIVLQSQTEKNKGLVYAIRHAAEACGNGWKKIGSVQVYGREHEVCVTHIRTQEPVCASSDATGRCAGSSSSSAQVGPAFLWTQANELLTDTTLTAYLWVTSNSMRSSLTIADLRGFEAFWDGVTLISPATVGLTAALLVLAGASYYMTGRVKYVLADNHLLVAAAISTNGARALNVKPSWVEGVRVEKTVDGDHLVHVGSGAEALSLEAVMAGALDECRATCKCVTVGKPTNPVA
ncbi:hypothetical protein GQ42DRAFT_21411 [Ramicandelaber brevisporus]|nr:hypothetical protein GQ42DRAFT_21411 [Ramicandelaber brevisporus]